MFRPLSNILFSPEKLFLPECFMRTKTRHPSLERLLELLKDHGAASESSLAKLMQETDQVITNWGRRGVSKDGALKAEEKFGCSPVWILKGKKTVSNGTAVTVNTTQTVTITVAPKFAKMCEDVCKMLATLPDDPFVCTEVAGEINKIISKARESPKLNQNVSEFPTGTDPT